MENESFIGGPGYRKLYLPWFVFLGAVVVSFGSAMVWDPAPGPGAIWWQTALHMACPVSLPLAFVLYAVLRRQIRRQIHAMSGRCCPACLYPQDPVIGRKCHECGHAFRRLDMAEFRSWAKLPPAPPAAVSREDGSSV